MPRIAKNEHDKGLLSTRKWRANKKKRRDPETDAVDTAIAAAVIVYRQSAEELADEKKKANNLARVTALETMAINFLVSKKCSREMATIRVRRRIYRLDADDLVPLVSTKPEQRSPPITT